ncbi:helix-turn-helix domain-containing protein [Actinomadura luteofluorescens]|uniref:helix-turn-helix domain-containing protein n=1 Tax=Actinomadura luteofluorescens TaxID=46163 RepID=UPI003629CA29
MSGHLHLHPQTVRYRLRQLDDLFGDAVHAASDRLELHMALRAWLALNAEPAAEPVAEPAAARGGLSYG